MEIRFILVLALIVVAECCSLLFWAPLVSCADAGAFRNPGDAGGEQVEPTGGLLGAATALGEEASSSSSSKQTASDEARRRIDYPHAGGGDNGRRAGGWRRLQVGPSRASGKKMDEPAARVKRSRGGATRWRFRGAQAPPKPTTTTSTSTTLSPATAEEAAAAEAPARGKQSGSLDETESEEYEEIEGARAGDETAGRAKGDEEEEGEEINEAPSISAGGATSTSTSTSTTTTTTTTERPARKGESGKPPPAKNKKKKVTPKKQQEQEEEEASSGSKVANGTTEAPPPHHHHHHHKAALVRLPFIKPKNESICTPEAYLEFPSDPIGNKWRARGFVIIHIGLVCYMFYSLALVCERYFMPSLEEFAERLHLSEDVAGATLMSAGSSAPELFTAILGVFIAKGDVGTGAIVGSAVFNILFVIGLCSFVCTTSAQLNWWPVLRDSVFYTFTVLVLILFIYDERVTALESFAMLALYGVYILIMAHNEPIKAYVTRNLQSHPLTSRLISSAALSMEGPDEVFGSSGASSSQAPGGSFPLQGQVGGSSRSGVEDDSMFLAACLVIVQHKRLFRSRLRFQAAARYIITKRQHRVQQSRLRQERQRQERQEQKQTASNEVNYFGPESEPLKASGMSSSSAASGQQQQHGTNQRARMEAYARGGTLSKNKFSIVSKDDYEFWNRPPEEGENYYIWLAKIPVNYVLHYTIPDCSLYPDKYLQTFFISIAWTALFSYVMVWMVTLIGYTLGVPDSVMGVTFLAAGTSIPDCYSSIHAARNGMADMAVSNSIGSNVFDILIGLSLPWFIQTAIYPGVVATINSRGVIYSVILLFLSLIVTIYLMNKYEWTLKPRLGLALLIAYGLFIVLTCMLEFNLFGHVNPPPCPVPG